MGRRRQHGEGTLHKRASDGRWLATIELGWQGGKRRRRSFTGTTPEAAIERRDLYLARKRDGFTMPRGRQPYVSEWVAHWLYNVAKARVAPTTWETSYRQKIETHVIPYFERVPLQELSEELVEAWHRDLESRVSERTGRPLSASTIGQTHRIFSEAVKEAVVRGKLPRNPVSNVTPPRADLPEVDPPTADEVRRILSRCQTWPNGARWILGITTGLRQGEALALEWRDVQLRDPASVTVRQSAGRVRGERVVKAPKSRSSRRTIPLAAMTARALLEHRGRAVRNVRADLVFTSARGGPVHPRADWQDWQNLLADLGLPRYRVHDMRHGYATTLLEAGVDPRVVQAMLGHATTALLVRYQHVRPVMHQHVADALDRLFGV
ncbi:MAG TPA: tyrosine-type recombinase/integrase [Streptosporangiaceae bacterium]|nr:tyrosine-type recombinase/integrase [Streptosporangiaceae bacterium]